MTRRRLTRETAFWPAVLTLVAIVLVGPASFVLGVLLLLLVVARYRIEWWAPLLVAGALVVAAPALVAAGAADAANLAATFAVVLGAAGVVLLAARERNRVQSGAS